MLFGDLPSFSAGIWVLLTLAAILVGLSKTAIPGINTISIAIMASVMPAKVSTGVLLVLLIVGDIFAMWAYRKHVNWPALVRLAPAVLVGLILGVLFLAVAEDFWVRRAIGVILLLVIVFTIIRRRGATVMRERNDSGSENGNDKTSGSERSNEETSESDNGNPSNHRSRRAEVASYGALAGFTTMVANAGGPIMAMYFLAARFEVKAFLGTAAWFFTIVNLTKVPFSVGLGLITWDSLILNLLLVPGVIAGAFLGRAIALKISQTLFDRLVIALTVVGALYLLVF